MKDYQSFLKEDLQGIKLILKTGNFIYDVDPNADFWFQETAELKEYKEFYQKAKDTDEKDIPNLLANAKQLDIFKSVPQTVWDMTRIANTEKVRTDKDCLLWIKDFIVGYLKLFLEWSENKKV
jgi:hypothetical protein